MDLAVRATPTGGESMAYALLMAVYNFGAQIGNLAGARLHDRFHLSIHTLIWISSLTTLLTLIPLPFLPASLVGKPDGATPEEAPETPGRQELRKTPDTPPPAE